MDELERLKIENEGLKKALCIAVKRLGDAMEELKRQSELLEKSTMLLKKQDMVVDILVDKLRHYGANI